MYHPTQATSKTATRTGSRMRPLIAPPTTTVDAATCPGRLLVPL